MEKRIEINPTTVPCACGCNEIAAELSFFEKEMLQFIGGHLERQYKSLFFISFFKAGHEIKGAKVLMR